MHTLEQLILEAKDYHKATTQWMEEHYPIYNKLYFDNELPTIHLEAKKSGQKWLGLFTWNKRWHYYRADRKIMLKGTWTPVNSILDIEPCIYINTRYEYTEEELENTLVHEMVHLYTYKDGICPKQGHGADFRAKSKDILKRSNGKIEITTYANYNSAAGSKDEPGWKDAVDTTKEHEEAKKAIDARRERKIKNGVLIHYQFVSVKNQAIYNMFCICSRSKIREAYESIEKRYGDLLLKVKLYGNETDVLRNMMETYGDFSLSRDFHVFWVKQFGRLGHWMQQAKLTNDLMKLFGNYKPYNETHKDFDIYNYRIY